MILTYKSCSCEKRCGVGFKSQSAKDTTMSTMAKSYSHVEKMLLYNSYEDATAAVIKEK